MSKTIVIAIGGNSLIRDAQHQTVKDQYDAVCETARHMVDLVEKGHRLIITHGNGPQVGFILLRSEYSRGFLHEVPIDSIVADTQGAIGYQIQQAIENEMWRRQVRRQVVTVVTQVLVNSDDPAFQKPTKPIGPFYKKEQAEERIKKDGWNMVEDAGRGWRRVIASPKPVRIIESHAVKLLVKEGVIVISAGGGGIPVIRDKDGILRGTAAVIDKDYASALLAKEIGADLFVISTGVEQVCLNFKKPDQKNLSRLTKEEAKRYLAEGHFAAGSMKPKIEACLQFLESGGKEALITSPEKIKEALDGKTGTLIVA
ncbi:MAG TPA: carbamate kinase [Elusimicrobiota bacterium]|nr:carbamate kinase [Elusimicrobiota bacterium]